MIFGKKIKQSALIPGIGDIVNDVVQQMKDAGFRMNDKGSLTKPLSLLLQDYSPDLKEKKRSLKRNNVCPIKKK